MSDAPQGPGWWLASDGKYYPPEQAPTAQPAAPPPAYQPQPTQPAKSSSGKGCLYAAIAVAVLAVVAVLGVIVLVVGISDEVTDQFEEAIDDDPCPFFSSAEATEALGTSVHVVQPTGLNQFLELTVDTRVLETAPDCVVISNTNDAALARVARYQGSDATAVFDAERDVADGTSEDRGGGLSVETEAYLNEDQTVELGDEGFCTTASLMGASGVLVRQGDTLVFVGLQPDFTSQTPSVDLEEGEFSTDDPNCVQAQDIASKILG